MLKALQNKKKKNIMIKKTICRPSGRKLDEPRKFTIEIDYLPVPEGSCIVKSGNTHVVCTATVEKFLPVWLRGQGNGWVTAEYGMLPRCADTRIAREASAGKQSSRTQEIQRLIGRSLRAVIDMDKLNGYQIKIDCDVIRADGGTRTAAICGSYVVLQKAVEYMMEKHFIQENPITGQIAAISCGIFRGLPIVDLDYNEDSNADTDINFVMTSDNKIVEIQGTAEKKPFSKQELDNLLDLGTKGLQPIFEEQKRVLKRGSNRRKLTLTDEVIIATGNMGKFEEFKDIISKYVKTCLSANDVELPDVEETENSFEGNAKLKALAAAKKTGKPVIADDSGFCVKKLNGAPGIYSKRYAIDETTGEMNYPVAYKKIMAQLGKNNRQACFVCCIVVAWPDGHTETVTGRVNGLVAIEPKGDKGFGYDPIFIPSGYDVTFAEMDLAEKQKVSHRGLAIRKMIAEIFEN